MEIYPYKLNHRMDIIAYFAERQGAFPKLLTDEKGSRDQGCEGSSERPIDSTLKFIKKLLNLRKVKNWIEFTDQTSFYISCKQMTWRRVWEL